MTSTLGRSAKNSLEMALWPEGSVSGDPVQMDQQQRVCRGGTVRAAGTGAAVEVRLRVQGLWPFHAQLICSLSNAEATLCPSQGASHSA